MNIHEYQAKNLLAQFNIPILSGEITETPTNAIDIAKKLGGDKWVIKSQVHAGGRGKAGGIKLAKTLDEVREHAQSIIGMKIVTAQTGAQGKLVRKVLIEKAVDISHEYYLGIVLNRSLGKITIIASSEGGMDIESVAHNTPEKIIQVTLSPSYEYSSFIGKKLSYGVGLKDEDQVKKFSAIIENLYKLYCAKDCSIAEINPLVLTKNNDFLALDAKLNFDDNALILHPDVATLLDPFEESSKELEANKSGLSYIELDGNIGCLVNGAGLAMATMDIIKLHNGSPANFLDVGGSATTEMVKKGCSIILSDSKVRAILINIFGGIMRCDVVAEGVVAALRELSPSIPVIVRLEGTNMSLGKKILNDSGLKIITANDLEDAAIKAVTAAK
ncbi:MAG: ADP-forming succinate--CoA ligase subunit beta [Oligoflexia bacterium]|nr:ADP-forming succinate--CoA ligase subunit beta [Oligoflexia bacterium]MBF0367429.1 ADP-forming succinate--CoA ligase subunit beta [Oligoflexia bacterium]